MRISANLAEVFGGHEIRTTNLLFVLAIGFGAAACGKRFRLYSIATTVILVACGALTGTEAPQLQANLPTPWIGVWERISIFVYMLWQGVLAINLMRIRHAEVRGLGREAA